MLASLFQGAQGLFVWTLDWLNFGARDPMGQESLTMVEASALHLTDVSQVQPTPKGSFEQVDRATVLDEIAAWANEAPAPTLNPAETDLIAAAAWLEQDTGSDADLIVQFALHDANGLTYDALLATAQTVAAQATFSPLIQPAIMVELDPLETAGLITMSGTADAAALDASVYLPLAFTLADAQGTEAAFDGRIGVWDSDLI